MAKKKKSSPGEFNSLYPQIYPIASPQRIHGPCVIDLERRSRSGLSVVVVEEQCVWADLCRRRGRRRGKHDCDSTAGAGTGWDVAAHCYQINQIKVIM